MPLSPRLRLKVLNGVVEPVEPTEVKDVHNNVIRESSPEANVTTLEHEKGTTAGTETGTVDGVGLGTPEGPTYTVGYTTYESPVPAIFFGGGGGGEGRERG